MTTLAPTAIADRIIARRQEFQQDHLSDSDIDHLADAEEADMALLAGAGPRHVADKARALASALFVMAATSDPSPGERALLVSLLADLTGAAIGAAVPLLAAA